jgi:hypothetical protein
MDYRVTMWPTHGATHNLFIEAPDALKAREYALRLCPEQTVVKVLRIQDLVAKAVQ